MRALVYCLLGLYISTTQSLAQEKLCRGAQHVTRPCTGTLLAPVEAAKALNCLTTQELIRQGYKNHLALATGEIKSRKAEGRDLHAAFDNALAHNKALFDKSIAAIRDLSKPAPWWKSDAAFFWYGVAGGVAVTTGGAWAVTQVKDAF